MPTISIFYGITILMHFSEKEHKPAHVHAKYGGYNASFIIKNGQILDGGFPPKATKMVKEFIRKNKKELLKMWDTQKFSKLKGIE